MGQRLIGVDVGGTKVSVAVLEDVRRIHDVNVYVWLPGAERWRLLTDPEQRALWEFRHLHRDRQRDRDRDRHGA